MTSFSENRYDLMKYRLCGASGLKLPLISLGLWQNFGADGNYETQRGIVHRAFEVGITHFDVANVYGPPAGGSEKILGKILSDGLGVHRHELVISTKAGYRAWAGPYGDGGSKKNIITSCDQSLQRTGLDYFDIFYHHRMDTEVPVAETMAALDQLVRQGKALYIGVSSHTPAHFCSAVRAIEAKNLTPLTTFMSRYNLLQRQDDWEKWPVAAAEGAAGVAFCPLAQGLLTKKYLGETPVPGSRMAKELASASPESNIRRQVERARALNDIAIARGQTLAQMSLAWVLRLQSVASALIGASSAAQVEENVGTLKKLEFTADELAQIDAITIPSPRY